MSVADVFTRLGTIGAIYLLGLMMICTLVPLAITVGVVYGMQKGLGAVDRLFDKVQALAERILQGTRRAMNLVARPLIQAEAKATETRVLADKAGQEAAGMIQNLKRR